MKKFILVGKVVSKTNNSGIAGLSVHTVPRGQKRQLATTLTNEDGGFYFIFQENELPENAKIRVVAYSIDKKEVSITKKTVTVKFNTQAEVEITADDELIPEHMSKSISLKPAEGRIIPAENLNLIYSAINLYGNTRHKYSFGGEIKPGLTCPFPELNDFDHVLIDAWETLQGNPSAFRRFKNSLDTVALSMEKRRGLKTRIDFNGAKWKRYIKEKRLNRRHAAGDDDPIVPLGKSALLMMGAKYIAGKDKQLANRYMNVVLSQLLEFYDVAPIYRICRDAMLGDPSAQSNVRHMIGIWGEDCGGRDPLLDAPDRGEWDPRKEPIDPHLEDDLACLNELANGSKIVEIREYSIDRITPNNGCSGDIAVISGSGFGEVASKVRFVGATINSAAFATPISWTDTRIEVAIPPAATYGPIGLEFPFRRGISACGMSLSVQYRDISSHPTYFTGGRPRIDSISFTKNNVPFDPVTETVLPGDTVSLIYENSPNAPRHSVDIRESQIRFDNGQFNLSDLIQEFNVLYQGFGGPARSDRQLQAMNFDRSTKITCEIDLTNPCGTTHGTADFIVHRPATISLTGIELTQATQFFRTSEHMDPDSGELRPDNSVPLIADKQTLARVYYTTNQVDSFNGGQSFGLSVELTARKDGKDLGAATCFNSNVLFASNDNSVLTQRGQLTSSANFLLPGTWIGPTVFTEPVGDGVVRFVNAPLRIKARLGIRDFEPWKRDRIDPDNDEFSLDGLVFNRAQKLKIMLVRYSIRTPNDDTFSRPGRKACVTALAQISEAYPTRELEVFFPAKRDDRVVSLNADLTDTSGAGCGTGWNSLLLDLGTKAFFTLDDDDMVWVGMVPPNVPLGNNGCGNAFFKLAAFPVNRHTTGMQEIGHAFGRDHPIQTDSDGDPTFPNYRGDSNASIGEFGVAVGDINPNDQSNLNNLVFNPDQTRDFMSPGRNLSLPLDGRWVSPHTYEGLMDDFFVAGAQTSSTTSALAEVSPRDKAEQIVIRGTIDLDLDMIALKPLFHERRSTLPRKGKMSPYVVELLNDSGRVIYTAPILTDGYGGRTFTFYHYAPYLKDCKSIQVRKGDAVLAKVERKEGSLRVTGLEMVSRENTRALSWEVEGTTEHWCWVEMTCDDGHTWIRLDEPQKITSISFDASKFGGGDKCRLRVMVTDGFNTSFTETDPFSLPLQAPQVVPINFDDKAEFTVGQTYDLKAAPVYIVGVPHQTELLWFLDDKEIGKGKRVSVQFGAGEHTIRIIPEKFKEAALVVQVIARKEAMPHTPEQDTQ